MKASFGSQFPKCSQTGVEAPYAELGPDGQIYFTSEDTFAKAALVPCSGCALK